MQTLSWREPATIIKSNLTTRVASHLTPEHYIVILWYGDSPASAKYVHMKQKFWLDVWIDTKLVGQWSTPELAEVIATIQQYNNDPLCVGIMCQLPLPAPLSDHKVQILETIDPRKDIDGLTGSANGKTIWGASQLYPATVASILWIMDHYGYGDVHGKIITIINKSNLIGKPLAMALVDRGAQVVMIGRAASPDRMREQCIQSDILITATGKGHLITQEYTNPSQVIIDAGVDFIDGKLVGDVDRNSIDNKIMACTPPTWGVWPMTVACLFDNVRILNS
jgi:methylenetetrahydrofolate dehydrogenase (NADP+) / methenyltetrahydrofolate cyclohydrolase